SKAAVADDEAVDAGDEQAFDVHPGPAARHVVEGDAVDQDVPGAGPRRPRADLGLGVAGAADRAADHPDVPRAVDEDPAGDGHVAEGDVSRLLVGTPVPVEAEAPQGHVAGVDRELVVDGYPGAAGRAEDDVGAGGLAGVGEDQLPAVRPSLELDDLAGPGSSVGTVEAAAWSGSGARRGVGAVRREREYRDDV